MGLWGEVSRLLSTREDKREIDRIFSETRHLRSLRPEQQERSWQRSHPMLRLDQMTSEVLSNPSLSLMP